MAISKVISIEINDLNTRLCEVSYNKKTPKVYQTLLFNNPEGSVEDSVVIDSGRYTEEFKTRLRAAGIKCKDAVFIISRVFGYLARFFILFQTEKSSREVVIS